MSEIDIRQAFDILFYFCAGDCSFNYDQSNLTKSMNIFCGIIINQKICSITVYILCITLGHK